MLGVPSVPDGLWPPTNDPRVDAVIALVRWRHLGRKLRRHCQRESADADHRRIERQCEYA